ncbi:hypothetical protein GCM10009798_36150 [Nocardioides panacihumi]|uniref:Uncharacterized protein n=1 Tax=Nocardioides panacihumi TaxID=400774 RepID=A0ABP5D3E8_9ACTN
MQPSRKVATSVSPAFFRDTVPPTKPCTVMLVSFMVPLLGSGASPAGRLVTDPARHDRHLPFRGP